MTGCILQSFIQRVLSFIILILQLWINAQKLICTIQSLLSGVLGLVPIMGDVIVLHIISI